MSPVVRMRGIRRISIGTAGIGEERIPIAIAAPAGGHILALGQGIKAAGHDGGSHVLAAILGSRRRRRHGDEGSALSMVIGAALNFKSCLMLVSLCSLFGRCQGEANGMLRNCTLPPTKKSNGIAR